MIYFREAYKQSMKPQKKQETEEEKVIIPEDLLCILCSDLLTDAIMMPCCGTSFCDECKDYFFILCIKFYLPKLFHESNFKLSFVHHF